MEVTCPHAAGAGVDCPVAMVATKRATYEAQLDELQAKRIDYLPVVWSAYAHTPMPLAFCCSSREVRFAGEV